MTHGVGDKGQISFGKLPEEKKGKKRAKEEEKTEAVFKQETREISSEKKTKFQQKATSKISHKLEGVTELPKKILKMGAPQEKGLSLSGSKRAPALVDIEKSNPDATLEKLTKAIKDAQILKKKDESIAVILTSTGKLKVQIYNNSQINTDFYKAHMMTEGKLNELCSGAKNPKIADELVNLVREENRPLVSDQLKHIDATLKLLDQAISKYSGDPKEQAEIKTLFRVVQRQINLHDESIGTRARTRKVQDPFNERIGAAREMREKALEKLGINLPVPEIRAAFARAGTEKRFLTQVALSGMVDIKERDKYIKMLLSDEKALTDVLQNDLGSVRELVRDYPELLDHPHFPKTFFNDFEVMHNASAADPSACLRMGSSLKSNPEQAKRVVKEALASLILGDHSEKVVAKSKQIHELGKTLLPTKDAEGGEEAYNVLEPEGPYSDPNLKDAINKFKDPSYSQFIDSLIFLRNEIELGHDLDDVANQEGKADLLAWGVTSRFSALHVTKGEEAGAMTLLLNSTDRDIVRKFVDEDSTNILYADPSLQLDPEFKEEFLSELHSELVIHPESFESPAIPLEIKKDVSFLCELLKRNRGIYSLIDSDLKKSASKQMYEGLLEGLKNKLDFAERITISVDENGSLAVKEGRLEPMPLDEFLNFFCEDNQMNDQSVLSKIKKDLLNDPKVMRKLIERHRPEWILLAPSSIQNDPEFKEIFYSKVTDLARENLNVLKAPFVPHELRNDIIGMRRDVYISKILSEGKVDFDESSNLIITTEDGKKTTIKELQEKFALENGLPKTIRLKKMDVGILGGLMGPIMGPGSNKNKNEFVDHLNALMPFIARELEPSRNILMMLPYFLMASSKDQRRALVDTLFSEKQKTLTVDMKPMKFPQEFIDFLREAVRSLNPTEVQEMKDALISLRGPSDSDIEPDSSIESDSDDE